MTRNTVTKRQRVRWGLLRPARPLAMILSLAFILAPAVGQEKPPASPPEEEQKTVASTTEPIKKPQSRHEHWRRQRLEKMGRLEPYQPGFVERNLVTMEKSERPGFMDLNFWGFYPRIQIISRGSGLGFGTRFWKPDIKGGRLDVHGSAFYSTRGYEFYDLQIGKIPHRGKQLPLRSWKGDDVYELGDIDRSAFSRFKLYASFRYRHLPQEDFFGLGPQARRQDHSSFLLQDASYEIVAGYQFSPSMALTLSGGLRQFSTGRGENEDIPTTQELFDESTAPGLTRQPDFTHFTSQLLFDFRDEPGNPHRGAMFAVAFSRFDDRGSEEFHFHRFAFDARGFLPLGSHQRVLALRALTIIDEAASRNRVPFYLQESLGGSHTFRGFDSFRFRGEKVILFQAEYRWEAAPALELVLFSDAGTVADARSRLELSNLEADYGFGFRLKTFRSTFFRLDLARSRETTRTLIRFSTSF
ncbi:outer membrane protein assembly factor [Acidobacteria bacterium AH-259-A15]|nr:outer membrane protein assembly factor [Acidobacteria bacterium AH-259-A15]